MRRASHLFDSHPGDSEIPARFVHFDLIVGRLEAARRLLAAEEDLDPGARRRNLTVAIESCNNGACTSIEHAGMGIAAAIDIHADPAVAQHKTDAAEASRDWPA